MKSIDKVWVKINSKNYEIKNESFLTEILDEFGFCLERIAVEKNGEILPRNLWKSDILKQNDNYEIVEFVAGG